MISNGQKLREAKSEGRWHYLAVKKLLALLREITSKHQGDFYCRKLQLHKRACKNKDFCNVNMPSDHAKILEFNQYQKSDKAPFIIYDDLECIIEKIDGCKNNPESSSTTQITEYILSGFLMSTISSFRSIENKYDVYKSKDCIKKFCEFLREQAIIQGNIYR